MKVRGGKVRAAWAIREVSGSFDYGPRGEAAKAFAQDDGVLGWDEKKKPAYRGSSAGRCWIFGEGLLCCQSQSVAVIAYVVVRGDDMLLLGDEKLLDRERERLF